MSDYTKTTNFTAKDNLTTGDPLKVIQGALFDTEFDNIATAVSSKYDSGDLASQAQAEAESANTVLMTPLRVANWADANGGMVGHIQALADPNADRLLFWDDSESAAALLTLGTGLAITTTTLATDDANIDHDALSNFVADEHVAHSGVSITAGNGLTGGGTIAATRTIDVGAGDGITANTDDVAVDSTVARTNADETFDEDVTVSKQLLQPGVVSDATLDGTREDDYAPTGHADAYAFRLTNSTATSITGIAGGVDGRKILIINMETSAGLLTLEDEDVNSAAANRMIVSGTGRAVGIGAAVELWYDGTSSRWRIISES